MTDATEDGAALAGLVRAAQLPEPAERERIRRTAGVSLRRMAEALGVSATTVWHWETGHGGPSLENAARYRALLEELAAATRPEQAAS